MNEEETFASRLVKAREGALLTQQELGEQCDITQTQISRYERGNAFPRPATLRMLASALGVEPEWLAKGEGRAKQMRISIDGNGPGKLVLNLNADPVTRDHFLALAEEAGETPEAFLVRLIHEHLLKLKATMSDERPFGEKPANSEFQRMVQRLEELEARVDSAIPKSAGDGKAVNVVSIPMGKPKP